MLAAVIMPWYTNGKYNQDLLVIVVYLKTVFPSSTFWESFNDNITFVYIIRKIFSTISPVTLIFVLHNISVILLTLILKKYLKPIYVCAIMLFCFFTIFCNQFRLCYALSLGLTGFMTYQKSRKLGIIYLLCSIFFHVFVAFFIAGILLVDIYRRGKTGIRILLISVASILLLGMFYFVTNNSRFGLYLERDESGFISTTFFLVGIACFLIWKSIDVGKRGFIFWVFILVTVTSVLPNISSRLGEMLFIMMCFLSVDATNTTFQWMRSGNLLSKQRRFFYFAVGLVFFSYRFINWVILGKIIRPEILDYL